MTATVQKNVSTVAAQFRSQIGAASDVQGAKADTAIQPSNGSSTPTVGKFQTYASFSGTPLITSSGSVFMLATGAYTDTMNYYFQRDAGYTGGGTADSNAGVLSPLRGEVVARSSVTYAVECGLIGISNNESNFAQAVGSFGQGNSTHGGRVWGLIGEGHEFPETFSTALGNLTVGQTSFTIPNHYAQNTTFVFKNGTQLTRGTGSTGFNDDDSLHVVLVTPVIISDVIQIWRGNPLQGNLGAEIDCFAGYGLDNANANTGNRIITALFGAQQTPSSITTHIGTGLGIIANSNVVIDRGTAMIGQFTTCIDLSLSSPGDWVMKMPSAASGGITAQGNIIIGSVGNYDLANIATINLGRSAGGIVKIGDGVNSGRILVSTSSGMNVGTETNIDLLFQTNATEKWRILSAGSLRPAADNTYSIGDSSHRISQLYAGTATINTSDRRLKTGIAELNETEKRVALKCKELIRSFKFNSSVTEKGSDARIHIGAIAQDIQDAFASENLDASGYALFCEDKVMGEREITVTQSVQKTSKINKAVTDVKLIDGKAVMVESIVEVDEPEWQELEVYDADGNVIMVSAIGKASDQEKKVPLTRKFPVMVDITTTTLETYDTGETRLGLRYEELLCFIIATL